MTDHVDAAEELDERVVIADVGSDDPVHGVDRTVGGIEKRVEADHLVVGR